MIYNKVDTAQNTCAGNI